VVTAGGGEKSLPCANAKNARQSLCLPCANAKTHGKYFFGRAFFFAVRLWTAKHLFAVRPKKYARQTFRRTANMEFPVVYGRYYVGFQSLIHLESQNTPSIPKQKVV
jgi:hypothetical protein